MGLAGGTVHPPSDDRRGMALALFTVQQFCAQGDGALVDLSVFRNEGFAFGFLASFAAGVALFGSAYLIPSFAVSVLGMTATDAGMLLLPSGGMFIGSLLLTAFLVRRVGLPPIVTVPFGILIFMTTMWMLSGSSGESGTPDMMPAIVLRGLGLGFLFLSITLITLVDLHRPIVAYGVALFDVGRQTGTARRRVPRNPHRSSDRIEQKCSCGPHRARSHRRLRLSRHDN